MDAELPPDIGLQQASLEPLGERGMWRIGWRVENRGAQVFSISRVRLPHGQFKSDEIIFDRPLELTARAVEEFITPVHCDEPPGLVTENAFVIFYLNCSGHDWRVFVRVRVTVNERREPVTVTESITTQRVGFSGVAS